MRFPRELSPDRLSLETTVGDAFSGYEWRVVLDVSPRASLVAFVIPPDSQTLRLPTWHDNVEAVRLGRSQVRSCDPGVITLRCGRPANGLVRLVDDQLELVIAEPRWFLAVSGSRPVHLRVAVRRAGEELWQSTLDPKADPP